MREREKPQEMNRESLGERVRQAFDQFGATEMRGRVHPASDFRRGYESSMDVRALLGILWRRRWIVLSALLCTSVATAILAFRQIPVYRATATFIVAPKRLYFADTDSFVDGLNILSRNTEIARTYVEVARSRKIAVEAATALDLSHDEREGLSIDSRLLAGTTTIEIVVEGPDPVVAQSFIIAVGSRTAAYMQELYEAYDFSPLDPPLLPTSPASPNKKRNLALGAIFGLALGAGLAFFAEYLQVPMETANTQREIATVLHPARTVEDALSGHEANPSHTSHPVGDSHEH
jgi:uncharacterized protein involved in exopolysaccharide biosynthesis